MTEPKEETTQASYPDTRESKHFGDEERPAKGPRPGWRPGESLSGQNTEPSTGAPCPKTQTKVYDVTLDESEPEGKRLQVNRDHPIVLSDGLQDRPGGLHVESGCNDVLVQGWEVFKWIPRTRSHLDYCTKAWILCWDGKEVSFQPRPKYGMIFLA